MAELKENKTSKEAVALELVRMVQGLDPRDREEVLKLYARCLKIVDKVYYYGDQLAYLLRHPRAWLENPENYWIPAYAGMTLVGVKLHKIII